jgi:Protein of unknown function (DUF3568)
VYCTPAATAGDARQVRAARAATRTPAEKKISTRQLVSPLLWVKAMPHRAVIVALFLIPVALAGCAALATPAVAPVVSAGGDLLKVGTSHTFGGASFRTFSAPLADVYDAVRATLTRLDFAVPEEKFDEEHVTLRAVGIGRKVRIDLQPITPALTQVRVFVRKDSLGKDPATASELMAQTERTLIGTASALPRQP